jgi:hypothetical protein
VGNFDEQPWGISASGVKINGTTGAQVVRLDVQWGAGAVERLKGTLTFSGTALVTGGPSVGEYRGRWSLN